MKNTLLTLLTITGVATASPVSENLAFSEPMGRRPVIQKVDEKKNIGHITFKVGPGTSQQNYRTLVPVFGIGYQSRLNDSAIFQSTMIEFGGAGKSRRTDIDGVRKHRYEGVFYYPKIMGIHYWNKDSENRLFTAVGSNISTSYYESSTSTKSKDPATPWSYDHESESSSQTTLGGSMAIGLEMGKPNEATNTIKVEYDQPAVQIYSEGSASLQGVMSISYIVGF